MVSNSSLARTIMMQNKVNYTHAWRGNRSMRYEPAAIREGQKDDALNPLTSAINDLTVRQGRGPKQKPILNIKIIIQRRRDKRSGVKSHHKIKGAEKDIRGSRGRMTGNRKGVREERTWQRIPNQRLRRASMGERSGKAGLIE